MSSPPRPRYQCSRFTNDKTIPLADYQALLHEHCLSHELGKLKAAGRDFSMFLLFIVFPLFHNSHLQNKHVFYYS